MVFHKIGDLKDGIKSIPAKLKSKSSKDVFKIKKEFNQKREISEEDLRNIANFKVMFKKSILMHLFVFLSGMILLVVINYLFTPNYLWYLFTLIGWPIIGVSMHGLTYLLFTWGVDSSAKRSVVYHIASYISVIAVLIIINSFTYATIFWVFYPTFFWGAGLVFHIVIYYMFLSGKKIVDGVEKSKKEIAIEIEVLKMKNEIIQKRG
jgi:hypothetical protein